MPRIYCCQHDIQWEDATLTCQRVARLLRAAAPVKASLVLLPEMFATGFTMNINAQRSDFIQSFLAQTASNLGIFLQAGVALPPAPGTEKATNASLTFDPSGSRIASYIKLHPFSFGTESKYYSPGESLLTLPWQGFTNAPFICYDLRFPEIFRSATLRGSNLLTVIANWPQERESHWLALLIARAIENQSYIAAVNRIGTDPKLSYSGRSLIIDPQGQILGDAAGTESVISAELDLPALTAYRERFPALSDIRPDFRKALETLANGPP